MKSIKKISIVIIILGCSMFSCTNSDVNEMNVLYEQSTEGTEEDIKNPRNTNTGTAKNEKNFHYDDESVNSTTQITEGTEEDVKNPRNNTSGNSSS